MPNGCAASYDVREAVLEYRAEFLSMAGIGPEDRGFFGQDGEACLLKEKEARASFDEEAFPFEELAPKKRKSKQILAPIP